MFSFSSQGSLSNTERYLRKMQKGDPFEALEQYAREGVAALANATPIDSGLTSSSWDFTIERSGSSFSIVWTNTNTVDGLPIAIMLQYGHGTGTGGYVQGQDYINPAMKPIFDQIAAKVWKAVTSA